MKWKRFLAALVVCMLAVMSAGFSTDIPQTALAAVRDEESISPMYLYTSRIKSGLSINDSGVATCTGAIEIYESNSEISLTATLYQEMGGGVAWFAVAGWGENSTGRDWLEIIKQTTVSRGTYKLVVRATVTAADGGSEDVSVTSPKSSYP